MPTPIPIPRKKKTKPRPNRKAACTLGSLGLREVSLLLHTSNTERKKSFPKRTKAGSLQSLFVTKKPRAPLKHAVAQTQAGLRSTVHFNKSQQPPNQSLFIPVTKLREAQGTSNDITKPKGSYLQ